MENLADPDALVDGERVVYSGTWDGRILPLFTFDAAGTRGRLADYDPSAIDPAYDYCSIWAPDIAKLGSSYYLLFAGQRVPKGQQCWDVPGKDQVIFVAETTRFDLKFGIASPLALEGGPFAKESSGCPSQGCDYALRIDATGFVDGADVWIGYTWFEHGNHNATVNLADPSTIIHNTDPTEAYEEGVNEAPEFFKRDGRYYFVYSTGNFNGAYRMRYLMGGSVPELTKAQSVSRGLTSPSHARDGRLLETHGHGTIFAFQGKHYAIYHVGIFQEGTLRTRHAYLSEVHFNQDGTMASLTQLELSWDRDPNYDYSLDVHHQGRWIGPCVDASILAGKNRFTYSGVCLSQDQLAPLGELDGLRLCRAPYGDWSQGDCTDLELPKDGNTLHVGSPLTLPTFSQETIGIQAVHSNHCLDVAYWSTSLGATVLQYSCHGGDNQRFSFVQVGDAFHFRNVHSGLCLAVADSSTALGADIVQLPCKSDESQRFALEPRGDAYALRNIHSSLCLDVAYWSQDPSANVIQYTCHYGDNQLFRPLW
ncbi:MAG: RICIN domain-containing protein [Deltaproteobacteria bacterium]|nr:RICIN domain-containing protein [Deltaproteobacteria bacterium]